MHYTLPGLRSKIEPVGLIEAISASIRFSIVSAPRWFPFAVVTLFLDLLARLNGISNELGGTIFAVWFIRFAGSFGAPTQATPLFPRLLAAIGAQLIAGLLIGALLVPFAISSELLRPAAERLGDPSLAPLTGASDLFGITTASLPLLIGSLLAFYGWLRCSQATIAAARGAGPIEALRRSLTLTRGVVLRVVLWSSVWTLLGLVIALALGALLALPIGLIAEAIGITESTVKIVVATLSIALAAPVPLGIMLTLFDRLEAPR